MSNLCAACKRVFGWLLITMFAAPLCRYYLPYIMLTRGIPWLEYSASDAIRGQGSSSFLDGHDVAMHGQLPVHHVVCLSLAAACSLTKCIFVACGEGGAGQLNANLLSQQFLVAMKKSPADAFGVGPTGVRC